MGSIKTVLDLEEAIRPEDVLPVSTLVANFPNLGSAGSIRWQIFCAGQNGLEESGAIIRRGSRVFVVLPRYMRWLTRRQRAA